MGLNKISINYKDPHFCCFYPNWFILSYDKSMLILVKIKYTGFHQCNKNEHTCPKKKISNNEITSLKNFDNSKH